MATNESEDWRDLFDAALFEPSRVKLRRRIANARHAINSRLDALVKDQNPSGSSITERIALNDALMTLAELQRIVYTGKPSASVNSQQGRAAG